MLSFLQRCLSANTLVGQCHLLCAIQRCLRRLKLLLRTLNVFLRCDLQDVLTSCKLLLAFLQSCLLAAVQSRLSRIEILLSFLQSFLSADTFIRQSSLLSSVKLRLRGLKVLSQLSLLSRKLLSTGLQTKLILCVGVELATGVDGLLIGQSPVGVSRCVGVGDWNRFFQHGRDASALSHRAVDQAARGHALAGLCAGQLHELTVIRQNAAQLSSCGLCGRVDGALLGAELSSGGWA